MKKAITLFILTIFTMTMFFGCVTSQEPEKTAEELTTEAKKEVSLKFVWQNIEDEKKELWMTYLINPFMEKFPNVKIDFQPTPNVADTIKVQVAAGHGPDLFMTDAFDIKDYASADRVLELESYSQKFGWDKIIYGWALDISKYKGKLYAVPHSAECTLMYYNKDILDANGWVIPKTRAEFEKVCTEAKEKGLKAIGFGYAGLPLLNQWLYEHYITNYAGIQATKDLFSGKIKFTDQPIKGAFELLKQDWDKGYWNDKQSGAIDITAGEAIFANQESVLNPEGSWYIPAIKPGTLKFNWGATSWPSMKDGVPSAAGIATGAVIAVNKSTKSPDEAAEFLNFMYSEEKLMAEGIAAGLEPLCRNIDPNLYPTDMQEDVKTILAVKAEAMKDNDAVGFAPWAFYPTKTNQYLYDNIEKVYYNKLTVDEYLEEAQKLLDQELKDGFEFAVK